LRAGLNRQISGKYLAADITAQFFLFIDSCLQRCRAFDTNYHPRNQLSVEFSVLVGWTMIAMVQHGMAGFYSFCSAIVARTGFAMAFASPLTKTDPSLLKKEAPFGAQLFNP
jgi:hypothetical protein